MTILGCQAGSNLENWRREVNACNSAPTGPKDARADRRQLATSPFGQHRLRLRRIALDAIDHLPR
jgi:hypothetical protein